MSDENMKTVEAWAVAKGTPDWVLAAVKATRRLGEGALMTEQEYEEAVNSFLKAPIR